jgi:hypothetical protein
MSQRIVDRAWRAYLATDGIAAERPTSESSVETVDGLTYVALRSERATLAVYRVTGRGNLRRIRRWPFALNTMGSERTRECAGADTAPQATP